MKSLGRFLIIASIFFGLTTQLGVWAVDFFPPYACVLNFERRTHPLSSVLNENLSDLEGVRLIHQARPLDILNCLDQGVVSILIVGHAADLNSKNQTTAPLVYFRELQGSDRQTFLEQLQKKLDQELAEFEEKVRTGRLQEHEGHAYYRTEQAANRVRELTATDATEDPIYESPRLVENQIWKRVLADPKNLKKISVISCLPEMINAHYPELGELKARGIFVEFGPINRFMSFIMGEHVASPDFDWMKKILHESRPK